MANSNEDLFWDNDPTDEGVEDARASHIDLRNAVLYHTDWTVETIINQINKGRIDIVPSFQRRDAWTIAAKSLLIESILLNFPIPPITLAEKQGEKVFIVVDGKQRLTSISQFLGGLSDSKYNHFKLTGLNQLSELNGCSYQDLVLQYPEHASALENYSIRTNVVRGWRSDDILYSIFHRLNSGSVKLSAQELRQSLNPGKFTRFINEYSINSRALRSIFPGDEPDFRMRDVELVTRYLSLIFFIERYSGNLKKHLDETVNEFNEGWDFYSESINKVLENFERNYLVSVEVFGRDNVFKKWNDGFWERRTNRAIFDSVMYNLTGDNDANDFVVRKTEVVQAFKDVSSSIDFRDSIEKTTKTTAALFTRIHTLGSALRNIGFATPQIELIENRIRVL